MNDFKIKITNHHFFDEGDPCSHGRVELVFNDIVISSDDDYDWTIPYTALQLLVSIDSKKITEKFVPLFGHCGGLTDEGCSSSIGWQLKHLDDKVVISNIKKIKDSSGDMVQEYDGLTVTIGRKKYISEIINFCDEVFLIYDEMKVNNLLKIYNNDKDETIGWFYFWKKFNKLYKKFKKELDIL